MKNNLLDFSYFRLNYSFGPFPFFFFPYRCGLQFLFSSSDPGQEIPFFCSTGFFTAIFLATLSLLQFLFVRSVIRTCLYTT